MEITIKLSYKLIPLILVGMARPVQIIQNNKFAKSLQYLKKEVGDEVDFLCRWTSQFSINWWVWSGIPKVLKVTSMKCLCNISRKNWVVELMFCMRRNMKIFYKLIVLFLIFVQAYPKYPVNLQYLFDILRKKLGMKLET